MGVSRLPCTVRFHRAYLINVLMTLAILIDPNIGEETKERAKEELGKHGVDIE